MAEKNLNDIKVQILEEFHDKEDLIFKMIIIGDFGVGKSCLTTQAIKNKFDETHDATVGFEFMNFNVKLDDTIIKLQIWDTSGQEVYHSLVTSLYKNVSLAMIVYAIDSKESFVNINTWLKDLRLLSNPDVKIFLIGNKTDLEDDRIITTERAKKFANENNFDYFNETSAKLGSNTKEVFIQAAKVLYLEYLKYKKRGDKYGPGNLNNNNNIPTKINKGKSSKRKNEGCC